MTAHLRDGLREIGAGDLEVLNDAESISLYESTFVQWANGDVLKRMPNGENGGEVFERFSSVVEEAAATGETVAVVSHGAIICAWVARHASSVDPLVVANAVLPNGGFVLLEGHPSCGWSLRLWTGADRPSATPLTHWDDASSVATT